MAVRRNLSTGSCPLAAPTDPDALTADDFWEIVVSDNEEAKQLFVAAFEEELKVFCRTANEAYRKLKSLEKILPKTERVAWCEQFLFGAINSLVVAVHLLVSGLHLAAGNQMRQFGESLALALLLASPDLPDYGRFVGNPRRYNTHKAVDRLENGKIRMALDLDLHGVKKLKEIQRFYDGFSHPSVMGAAVMSHFDKGPGWRIIGSGYDAGKREAYAKELRLATSGAERAGEVVDKVADLFLKNQP